MSFTLDSYLEGSMNPKNAFNVFKYNYDFHKNNPTYFYPEGITVFCGSQGSGKTLSAVQMIKKIISDYPNCILCTNTNIKNLPKCKDIIKFEGVESLVNIENGIEGVIYFIDEIHLFMNSLESKNISISAIKEISQGRKQRKLIIGTSQVYQRMAKPLREQIKNIICCKKIFNCFQINKYIDGDSTIEVNGELKYDTVKYFFWFHSPFLYDSYDTYQKMKEYIHKNKSNNFKINGEGF